MTEAKQRYSHDPVDGFREFEVWAVDLDGCLLEIAEFPACGEPVPYAKEALTLAKSLGFYIIINTCRHDESLEVAKECLVYHGIPFDGVNENYAPWVNTWGDSRKVAATRYFDDRNWGWSKYSWSSIYYALLQYTDKKGEC